MERSSIILWRHPETEDVDFSFAFDMAYEMITCTRQLPPEYAPRYLAAMKKKDRIEVDFSREGFCKLLKRSAYFIGGKQDKSLGYRFALFSSYNSMSSFRFDISVGDTFLINTLVIGIAFSYDLLDKQQVDMILDLFEKEVNIFQPYFGCIVNSALHKGPYLNGLKPTSVHWVNYWSEEILSTLPRDRVERISERFPRATFNNGILKLQELGLDEKDPDTILYLQAVQEYLLGTKGEDEKHFA